MVSSLTSHTVFFTPVFDKRYKVVEGKQVNTDLGQGRKSDEHLSFVKFKFVFIDKYHIDKEMFTAKECILT